MDRSRFFAALRKRGSGVFGTSLSKGQLEALNRMLDEGQARGLALRHLAYVLATPYHEVGFALQPKVENLNYTTAAQIRKTWPSRLPSTAAAQPYVRNPQKLANRVHGSCIGNTGPNDGWVYRGRGLPQITGKGTYAIFSHLLGIKLVANSDRAMELRIAAYQRRNATCRHGLAENVNNSHLFPKFQTAVLRWIGGLFLSCNATLSVDSRAFG